MNSRQPDRLPHNLQIVHILYGLFLRLLRNDARIAALRVNPDIPRKAALRRQE